MQWAVPCSCSLPENGRLSLWTVRRGAVCVHFVYTGTTDVTETE